MFPVALHTCTMRTDDGRFPQAKSTEPISWEPYSLPLELPVPFPRVCFGTPIPVVFPARLSLIYTCVLCFLVGSGLFLLRDPSPRGRTVNLVFVDSLESRPGSYKMLGNGDGIPSVVT